MGHYPEHEKFNPIKDDACTISNFLEWLLNESPFLIGEWMNYYGEERLVPTSTFPAKLIALYFNIDYNKFQDEKDAMLEECREQLQ